MLFNSFQIDRFDLSPPKAYLVTTSNPDQRRDWLKAIADAQSKLGKIMHFRELPVPIRREEIGQLKKASSFGSGSLLGGLYSTMRGRRANGDAPLSPLAGKGEVPSGGKMVSDGRSNNSDGRNNSDTKVTTLVAPPLPMSRPPPLPQPTGMAPMPPRGAQPIRLPPPVPVGQSGKSGRPPPPPPLPQSAAPPLPSK